MNTTTVDCYYTLSSPWAYFAGPRLADIARRHNAKIVLKPYDFQQVVPKTGGIPLLTRPEPRQRYHALELDRWRRYLNMPLNLKPRFYPPADNKTPGHTVIAAQQMGTDAMRLSHAILRAIWAEERNVALPQTRHQIAVENGLDGTALIALERSESVVSEYRRNTQEVEQLGIFGSPTYVLNGELFWGQDRLDFLDRAPSHGGGENVMVYETDGQAAAYIATLQAKATRRTTSSADGDMVWHVWGDGRPLVLLHGGSGSWTHWVFTIEHFMNSHQVIVADLPGLGDSPSPREPYDATSLASMVAQGIDQLLSRDVSFDLAGFSFGGIVAGHIGVTHSPRLRTLSIVGSPAFGIAPSGPANDIVAVSPALSLQQAEPLHRRNLTTLMFADAERIDALALRIHHDNLRRARLKSRKIARSDCLARAIKQTHCRLHGIWGELDITVHPDMKSLEALFLDTRMHNRFDVIANAGHWVMHEAPDAFNHILHDIVNDHDAAAYR